MKKLSFLLLTILFFIRLNAQENLFVKEITKIADAEKKAAGKRLLKGIYSNASGDFTVYYYRCEWKVDPAIYYIDGNVTSYFITTAATQSITFDLAHQLTVDSVLSNGNKLNFSQDTDETVKINFFSFHNVNQKDSVTIFYHGVPAGTNNSFGYFVTSLHNNIPVLWTLSEPYGSRDWWPCRNGLDDKADSIDIYITHPSQYKASSNGLLIDTATANGFTTTHYKHRYPIASYLVAIAVTNYSTFIDTLQLGTNNLPIIQYIYPEDSAFFQQNKHYLYQVLPVYNTLYDVYPFMNERYGQTEFGFSGGQEHQTNSFVYAPGEDLMAHELAHQWFGDKVTCASWQDIWLNEGFASYSADFLYMKYFSPYYYPLYVSGNLSYVISQPDGSVFVDDTTNVDRIFDSRLTYGKGSFLVRMLEWTLGDSLFFKGLRQYLEDPKIKYGFAHTADLQRNLEEVSGMNLDYFFKQWLYGQGYPMFTVQWSENNNNFATINISQTTSHPSVSFYKLPLQLVFKNATQEKSFVINDTINNQQATLDIGFSADSILIDPQQWLISAHDTAIKLSTAAATNLLQVYPNPFTNEIIVSIKNPTDTKLQMELFNALGQKVFFNSYDLSGADQTFDLPVSSLAHGLYFLRISGNTVKFQQKLVK